MTPRAPSVRTIVAVFGLLVLAAAFAALGAWQWRRAAESRALAARFAAAADEPALATPPDTMADPLRFRRLDASGSYSAERQFLLDNRVHDGVAGYEVLTPLRLAVDGRWLVVNRGWVAADPDRRILPDVRVDSSPRRVTGRIERFARPGVRLGAAAEGVTGAPVVVVSYPTAGDLAASLGHPLLDYQLLLDPDAPEGFVRDWRAPGLMPERHVAYAGQWLLLALGALGAGVAVAAKSRSSGVAERSA